ncbi:MAG TPA: FkbM family methyltransferase [Blastocatellia bacterium]|nr:FkbM family methyltransferase [Blastocatellia bacterium]
MTGALRRFCQTVRHAPGLRELEGFWGMMRGPYNRLLRVAGGRRGITVRLSGFPMRLDPVFASFGWEQAEARAYSAFAAAIRPGQVVFDVGAYIGTYTFVALARSAPDGHVVAYEPQAAARAYLEKHLEWNRVADRVTVRPVSCAALTGANDFYCIPGVVESRSGFAPLPGFVAQQVVATRLDDEVRLLGVGPAVIKIDVEGAEWDVLKGAERTLLECRPVLFLSLHPPALAQRGESCEAILRWLTDLGYGVEELGADHEVHICARPL